jgi:hypothetical protein
MQTADSCAIDVVRLLDGIYGRVRYGAETDDWGARSGRRCHDCNVAPGGLHHRGCDVERCPRCGEQLIGCGCQFPEDAAVVVETADSVPDVIDSCGMRLWEAAQTRGCRRALMTFIVAQGPEDFAVAIRLEVDADGDVVWVAEDGRRVVVYADGTMAGD